MRPPEIPETNYSFDACILANSQEVIFKNVDNPGVYTHMSFEAFSDIIQQSFHQTLLIEVKPFHQALVLVESIFYFKPVFNDTDVYQQTNFISHIMQYLFEHDVNGCC